MNNHRSSPAADRLYKYLPLLVFAIVVFARLIPGPRTIDDSFITYRYARNILAGNGFTYNPGEQVLGTTTPFYTILMVALGSFMGGVDAPFAQISWLLNALLDGLTCLLIIRIGNNLGFTWAGYGTALAWAIAPYSVTFSIGGLETSLYVFLLIVLVIAHLENKNKLSASIAGLALLTRPDALILVAPLFLDRFIASLKQYRSTRNLFVFGSFATEVFLTVGVYAFWAVFALSYFGSIIPHSILAKTIAYRLPQEAALVRLIQHYATPFMEYATFGTGFITVGLFLYPFLYIVGSRAVLQKTISLWPVVLYPWLYFAAFSIANPLIFRWYLTPPLVFLFFFILTGIAKLLTQTLQHLSHRFRTVANGYSQQAFCYAIIIVLLPSSLLLHEWTLQPDHGPSRPAPEMAFIKLELLYDQAAQELQPLIASSDHPPLLAAGDVGVLGFITSATILDTVGLNSPQTIRYYPLDPKYYAINYAIAPDLIIDKQPDILVIQEVYGRNGLLKDPRFLERYSLYRKLPNDIYGSDGMLIYLRKDFP